MPVTTIVGIDLSGPSNAADTCVVVARARGARPVFLRSLQPATDEDVLAIVGRLRSERVVIGLDAPLSYQPGGGLRERDRELQKLLTSRGMRPGSVMPPTFNRMAYLTLRGMAVARLLGSLAHPSLQVIEVHPGAALCLAGAPIEAVVGFKKHSRHRAVMHRWLTAAALRSVPSDPLSDHFIAACGAVLAAWRWSRGASLWQAHAAPPFHPYPFAA